MIFPSRQGFESYGKQMIQVGGQCRPNPVDTLRPKAKNESKYENLGNLTNPLAFVYEGAVIILRFVDMV